MRVLYFSRGATAHDHRFLSALAHTPHRVYWMRLEGGPNRGAAPEVPDGVEPVEWFAGRDRVRWQDGWKLMRGLQAVIDQVQPDVIHAGPIQSCAFLAALAGAQPLVSMSWGSDLLVDADRNPLWRWATQFTLRRSRVLIADCRTVATKALELGFPGERTVIFPWGVDLDRFSPGDGSVIRARYGWENQFVLLCLRSWEPIYGVDVVARAFVRAAKERPDLRLILAGGGSREAEIRAILSEGGVLDRVAFPGRVDLADLPGYYQAADLYLSASHSDGSSVSLMEALACGRPVLISDIPSNREWVTPGQQGWLFPDGNDRALAEALLAAAARRDCLAPMGEAARQLALQRADWNVNFQGLLQAYALAIDSMHHPLSAVV